MQYSILSKAFSTSFSFFQFLSVRKLPFPFILHPVDYIIIIFFQSRDESNVILCGSNNSRNTITLHAPNKYHLHSHWPLRLFNAKRIGLGENSPSITNTVFCYFNFWSPENLFLHCFGLVCIGL